MKDGCFDLIKLYTDWETKALLYNSTGWIARINQGELHSVTGPPDTFLRSVMLNAKSKNSNSSQFSYRLGWSAGPSDAEVGENPPSTLLSEGDKGQSGATIDPGFMTLDRDRGDIYAVAKRTGRYVAWLIVTDLGGTAAAEGLPSGYDEVVLKKWEFEVTAPRRLNVISSWNPRVNTTNMLSQYAIDRVYELPSPSIAAAELFVDVAGGDPDTGRCRTAICF